MKPTEPRTHLAACKCGWSLRCRDEEERAKRLRYHRIVVHNDQEAVHGPAF